MTKAGESELTLNSTRYEGDSDVQSVKMKLFFYFIYKNMKCLLIIQAFS